MLSQLSERTPLRHPDRFGEAHRTAVRAVEVFDRNAGRAPSSHELSPEFLQLRLARKQMTCLSPDLSTKSFTIPAFLLGGAVLSTITSYLQRATSDRGTLLLLGGLAVVVCLAGFWCILAAAGIARRRARIALDQPLHALWETIGADGNPPRDNSRHFARSAALLLLLGWIVVPLVITAVITLT
jgi:hypothetical protein